MNSGFIFLFLTYFIFLSSCRYSHYNPQNNQLKAIFIDRIENLSFAPQVGSLLRNKIREHIIKRGRYKLVSQIQKSDLVLKLTFKNYLKTPEFYSPKDTILASGVSLNLEVVLNLFNKDGDTLIRDYVIKEGSSLLRQNSLSIPSDRQTLVSLSDACAKTISIQLENYIW